jgi:hypothetical protein
VNPPLNFALNSTWQGQLCSQTKKPASLPILKNTFSLPSLLFPHLQQILTHIHLWTSTTTCKMAWRGQGITGSNNIPLGSRRRFGGSDSTPPIDDAGYNTQSVGNGSDGYKRGRSQEKGKHLHKFMSTIANHQ